MDVATAAGFVRGILQVVFDKYYGSKLEQWAARSGLQDDACNLKTQLRVAHAVLEIVGRVKPVHNGALSDLIKELKLAAYGADDALDEMDYYRLKELVENTRGGTDNPDGASSSAVQMAVRRSCNVLSNPFKRARTSIDSVVQGQESVQPSFDRDAMSARIRSISAHLEKTADKVQKVFKLEKLVSMAAHPQPEEVNLRQTSSFLTEAKVFGRDEEINSIINMVLSKHLGSRYKNFSVLPIVGIGGVGKTTLAQSVYNHHRVVSSFDVRAWACISDTLDVTKVTVDIVDSINGGESHEIGRLSSLDAVQKTLMKKIEGKRFFIVLDDVWVNNWDRLCAPFSSGESGSMVVVTTRDQKIAEVMGSFDSVTLHGLQDDEFWAFFKQCANITEENNLAHIGRTIAKKLHGIPLAAKTMGRLLSKSHNEERWRSFLNSSNMWEVRQDPDDIMPVLRLSFQHLPPSLQCCFAYCAVFPKDYKISEQQLIFGWMAQGFIQKLREDEILEDIAKEYLNELLWGSFFEKVDGSHYMMHDLLHDLALLVSEDECWVTNDKPVPAEVCHLVVSEPLHALDMGLYGPPRGFCLFSGRRTLSTGLLHLERLKTLIFTGSASSCQLGSEPITVGNDWPATIRSLCLPNITKKEQLIAVSNLKHLRYLDINSSDLEELPEEICKLYHLQVLNIKGWPHLRQLPPSMSNLVNLRHLLADEGRNFLASIPNVGNMTSLNDLDMFCIGKTRGFDIAQLKDLRNLTGRLKIENLENVGNSGEASEARLNSKRRLTELSFSWSTNSYTQMSPSAKDVLEGLQPYPNVASLHVKGYNGSTSPTWLADKLTLTSLESLYLEDFSGLDFLPPLGQLPHLRKLHITKMGAITTIGPGFYGDGQVKGFPRLEEMLISNMAEWTEWVGVEHICLFPVLRSLIIQNCPKLNGLQVLCCSEKQCFPQLKLTLSSLESLYLEGLSGLDFLPSLGQLPHLRKLHITKMAAITTIGLGFYGDGQVKGFPRLEEMLISDTPEWTEWVGVEDICFFPVLRSLIIQHCPKLNGLQVLCCSEKQLFPPLLLTLSSLESLYLEGLSGLDFLPSLGQLPHLRKLHITKMGAITTIGPGFYGDGQVKGFPRLEEMLISNMAEWTEWVGVEHICFFPVLRSLIIQHCPKLNGLQVLCCSEKQWFPQLTRLEIEDCPEVVSFPCLKNSPSARIQENGSFLMKLNQEPMKLNHQEPCIIGYKVFPASKLYCAHLESLYLEDFSGLDFLPPLGQLPHLRKLHITKMGAITTIGPVFYGDGQVKGFPRLEEMLISGMPEWIEWVGVEHICFFPVLRSLIIQHCPKLNGLHVLCCSEKQWFPQLTRLEIEDCPELVSFLCLKHSPSVRIQEKGSFLIKLNHREPCLIGYKVFPASMLYCAHLESLYLEDCLEVEVLPPLGSLPQLRKLHMIRMCGLRQLGSEFYGSGRIMGFPCLNELSIKYLPEWRDWNEGGHFDLFPHLESLTIDNCPELNRVPCILARRENLRWFPSLNSLEIQCCPKSITFDLLFPQLPQFVNVDFAGQSYWISLGNNRFEINERGFTKSIPRTTDTDHWINSKLVSAEKVDISGSSVTDELLSDIFACHICPSLLTISGCERISTLDLSHLESLESLEIDNCDSLRHLSGLQAFIALKKLTVFYVPGFLEAWNSLLESGQTQQENFSTSLDYLQIDTASFLTSPFCSSLTSLKKLQLMDDDIESFSEQQEQALTLLTSLEDVTIGRSSKLLALPGALHEVSTLKRLGIVSCPSIKFVDKCFHKIAALEVLSVVDVPNFAEAWKMHVEAEGMHMEQIKASLQVLIIDDFKILNVPVCKLLANLQKLVIIDTTVAHISEEQGQALLLLSLQELEFTICYMLNALPNVLHRMLTLKQLKVTCCGTINSLPDDGLPASLEKLTIGACRKLYDKCLEHGTERHKITHISEIILER